MSGICAIGLYNPKTIHNIGSVVRSSHAFDVNLIVVQGRRYKRASTDTSNGISSVPLIQTDDLFSVIPYDTIPVGIEYTDSAPCISTFAHPKSCFYMFGPEDGSLPPSVLNRCKYVLKIPTRYCLNLAVSVGIVLYDRISKQIRHESVKIP